MKKIFILLSAFILSACQSTMGTQTKTADLKFTVDTLKNETVALVNPASRTARTFCTGVWVAHNQILTADHCVKAVLEAHVEDNENYASEKEKEKLMEKLEDGFEMSYAVNSDSNGSFKRPKNIYTAHVVKHDTAHDLALLETNETAPEHPSVVIASEEPLVGSMLHVMGHPIGLTWSYTRVMVAAYHYSIEVPGVTKKGPWMQAAGEVTFGNSGGGAFNEALELVGVVSWGPSVDLAPNETFFVHLSTIRQFMAN